MSNNKRQPELPSIEELEAEIVRKKHKQTQHHLVRNALYALASWVLMTITVSPSVRVGSMEVP